MRWSGKMRLAMTGAGFFAAVLVTFGPRLLAQESGENPYLSIVDRNVFALKPPPDPEAVKPPAPPPPPIELQGISVLFGKKRVLFTVTVPGGKPGAPPERKALILAEGERQDEVEVLEIDEKSGTVKFNNHGQEDLKTLAKDSSKIVAAPAPAAPPVPGAPPQPSPPAAAASPPVAAGHGGSTLRNIPTRPVRVLPVAPPQPPAPPQPAQPATPPQP
ncbi:MAG: hypothetical protein N3I86_08440 [Verrucomicrobiae bacterium]|nr:hypothetical protein [Verrucomicrobiae bacterium]